MKINRGKLWVGKYPWDIISYLLGGYLHIRYQVRNPKIKYQQLQNTNFLGCWCYNSHKDLKVRSDETEIKT